MISVSRFHEINILLNEFDNHQYAIDEKKKIVDLFVKQLEKALKNEETIYIRDSTFVQTGGSYEGTAIGPRPDYDIAMILKRPTKDEFNVVEVVDEPGFYKIRFLKNSKRFKPFLNSNKYLKINDFRKTVFDELTSVLNKMENSGWRLKTKKFGSVVHVWVELGEKFSIDIAPQISGVVRDSVRIAKAVAKKYGWYGMGLRSFHIKRIAILLWKLIDFENDPWNGYILILKEVLAMLDDEEIEGVFIENQNLNFKSEEECTALVNKIEEVLNKVQPNNILQRLGY